MGAWAIALVLALTTMDDDWEYPTAAVRVLAEARAGAWNRRAPNVVEWSDEEDGEPAFDRSAAAGSSSRPRLLELIKARRDERNDGKPSDGRGGYSREGKGKEAGSGYAKDAWTHFKQAEEFALGRPCLASCPHDRKCGLQMTPAHLLRAHIQMYGDNTTMQEPSEPGGMPLYSCALTFDQVKERRRNLVLNSISFNAADTSQRVERFMVASVGPVCSEYCRAAHGVPVGTWTKLLAAARAGRLQAGAEWDAAAEHLPDDELTDDAMTGVAKEETIEWWIVWLILEDQMPNEPVIVHRIVIWDSVHELEYKPDMLWFGTTRPLSRPRWVQLRTVALERLSIEWFGAGADGKPLTRLSLTARASHSNFASCTKCLADKQRWVEFRTRARGAGAGATPIDARALKEELYIHIREVKWQRTEMMRLAQECASRRGWRFGYDDGCGSSFMYMPSQVRDDGAHASRYKYRFAMMGNHYPGHHLRCSLVPPCIVKGANFGCTAYFSDARLGVLGEENVRQTDSGPDNDRKATHALHWTIVHYGVLQKLTWGRLLPKHSHNLSDRYNSMVKEVIWPQSGTGGGCLAPWNFWAIAQSALRTQQGVIETAWHWTNTNFVKWFADAHSINSNFQDFADHVMPL